DGYSIIGYQGKIMPPPGQSSKKPLTADEVAQLLQNNPDARPSFDAVASDLSPVSAVRVEQLERKVYTRHEDGGKVRIMADRFDMSEVIGDEACLSEAKNSQSAQGRFLQTFLPQMTRWQDSSCLSRASPDGE